MTDKAGRQDMYRNMISSSAWRELRDWMEKELERSMQSIDAIPARELSVGHIAEERGYRKGLRRLFEQAEYVKENG